MKVLHVTQGYSPAIGGTEWLMQRVSEELVNQFGDEVTVFTTNCYSGEAFFTPRLPRLPVGWEDINGVRVRRFAVQSYISRIFRYFQGIAYFFGLPGNQYLRALAGGPIIPGLVRAIQEHKADVVAASSFPLLHMFAALKAAEESDRPCVLIGGLHPQDHWGFDRPMIYQAIRRATNYIAYTDFEAQFVIGKGVSSEKVVAVGVGVDPQPFERVSTCQAKQYLGVDCSHPLIGFIGQIGGFKGADTLVRAMPLVWELFPSTRLLIAGARTLFSDQLEKLIRRLPEENQEKIILRYNFANEEKPWLFNAADVVAYPSGYESFGISYLEAWSSHKPVIGCWRGAIPWVVQAGRDGLLVEFQNGQLLAEAINLLLENPKYARALGEAGYQKVLDRYTWPEIARRFRQVYQDALEVFPDHQVLSK
jgi:glycosyltransferase involved in cell wall biosynthesis